MPSPRAQGELTLIVPTTHRDSQAQVEGTFRCRLTKETLDAASESGRDDIGGIEMCTSAVQDLALERRVNMTPISMCAAERRERAQVYICHLHITSPESAEMSAACGAQAKATCHFCQTTHQVHGKSKATIF